MRTRFVSVIAALAVVVGLAALAPSAEAGSCTHRTGVRHTDPYGNTYTRDWVCGNRGGAWVYSAADFGTLNGWLDTTRSWFVCYRVGAPHVGGNNIWYYTQGDRVAPGRDASRGWGNVPAVNVWTGTDPWPGMPAC